MREYMRVGTSTRRWRWALEERWSKSKLGVADKAGLHVLRETHVSVWMYFDKPRSIHFPGQASGNEISRKETEYVFSLSRKLWLWLYKFDHSDRQISEVKPSIFCASTLIENGEMEYVSISWASQGEVDNNMEQKSSWTVNLALWFIHILAGDQYEARWQYGKLGDEKLAEEPSSPATSPTIDNAPFESGSLSAGDEDEGIVENGLSQHGRFHSNCAI
jgi:hypothetical protein